MTTFQSLILSALNAVSTVWPLPIDIATGILKWSVNWDINSSDVIALQSIAISGVLLFHFRFEVLGAITGLLSLVFKPHLPKTLDEMTAVFLILINLPTALTQVWLTDFDFPVWLPALTGLVGAFFWKWASRFGKKTKGLNHIRYIDALFIGLLLPLSLLPGIGLPVILFALFWATNYSDDATDHLVWTTITIQSLVRSIHYVVLGQATQAWDDHGKMNSIVIIGISVIAGFVLFDLFRKAQRERWVSQMFWLRFLGSLAFVGLWLFRTLNT